MSRSRKALALAIAATMLIGGATMLAAQTKPAK
jgi:hypothetical protein